MKALFVTLLFAVISAAVVFFMAKQTNRMLLNPEIENESETPAAEPYCISRKYLIIAAILIAVSAICGYRLCDPAYNVIAIPTLGFSYMAALAAAVMDLKTRRIPNYIPLALIAVRVLLYIYEFLFTDYASLELVSSLIAGFSCYLLLRLANRISKGGIGGGDIKLISAIGFACGIYPVYPTMLISLLLCALYSIVPMLGKKLSLKNSLPFGPFIYTAFALVCIFKLSGW